MEKIMEEWRYIPGYEGRYQVSDMGRVKSMRRRKVILDVMLKLSKDTTGYISVSLSILGVQRKRRVHQLVAMAFLDYVPDGSHRVVSDHINNIKTDNRLCNLQLISARENCSKDRISGSSEYTGVSWHKTHRKWSGNIFLNGKTKYLGLFKSELDAANAYQEALSKIK